MPGFPKALARTLHELRLAGVRPVERGDERRTPNAERPSSTDGRDDLFRLLARVEDELGPRGRRRSRGAVPPGGRGVPRRPGALGAAADAAARCAARLERRAGICRGADRRDRPTCWRRCPTATRSRCDALERSAATVEDCRFQTSDFRPFRLVVSAPVRLHDRASGGARACRRRRACSRRLARGAKRSRSFAACSTRPARGVPFDEMAVFLRTPQQYLGPARARLRARRRAGLLRSRHPASRSGRTRVRRAAVVRGRRAVGEALRRVPVARPGAAGRRTPAAAAALVMPRDEVFADEERRGGPLSPPDVGPIRSARPIRRSTPTRSRRRRHAAVAVEVGRADRRVGGGRRAHARRGQGAVAPAAGRSGRRLQLPHRRAEAGRAGVGAHRAVRARSQEPRAPAPVRAADRRRARRMAAEATWGEWIERFTALAVRGAAAARARAADAGGSAADGRRRPGDARGSARRAARSAGHARLGAAGPPLRPAVRRHAASGARPIASGSSSCPGLAERVVPQRPREDPLLLDERPPRDRSGAGRPGRAQSARSGCC